MGAIRPLLVILSGAPATGKTTLARRLAQALGLPLLARDPLREVLCDGLRPESFAEAERIGAATYPLFYHLLREQLTGGFGVVAEANFYRGTAESELRPLVAISRAVLVHLTTDQETSKRRFGERSAGPDRHWSYFDAERLERIRSGARPVDWSRYEPMELGIPTLVVDTTDGYRPGFDDMVDWIRFAAEGAAR
jgi:predicted kinase